MTWACDDQKANGGFFKQLIHSNEVMYSGMTGPHSGRVEINLSNKICTFILHLYIAHTNTKLG